MTTIRDGGTRQARWVPLFSLCVVFFVIFSGLGVWQIQRRAWKLALIEAVDQRVHALPAPAPGPVAWAALTPVQDRYRHIAVTGHFLNVPDTFVQAVTDFGGGSWVLSPFHDDRGFTVFINRGFTPAESKPAPSPQGTMTLSGLLRLSEPKGGFLRANQPAADRWFSRDVAAIAETRHIAGVAPYFIDEDATSNANANTNPRAGLTVVSFPNNHLTYAATWFCLALLSAFGAYRVMSDRKISDRD